MKKLYSLSFAENRLVFKQPAEQPNRGPEQKELPPNIIKQCDQKFKTRFDQINKFNKPSIDKVIKTFLIPKKLNERLKEKVKGFDDYAKMFPQNLEKKLNAIMNDLNKVQLSYNINDIKSQTATNFMNNVFTNVGYNPTESSNDDASISDAREIAKMQTKLATTLNGKVQPAKKIQDTADNSIELAKQSTLKTCGDALYTKLESVIDKSIDDNWGKN